LWEQQINADSGQWTGYTPHYHKIVSTDPGIRASTISQVSIDAVSSDATMLVNSGPAAQQVTLADIGRHDA
jgi:hypothetical protein